MSQKVKKLQRILNYTAVYLVGVLTVTTDVPHLLISGDSVTIQSQNSPQEITATITAVSSTEFSIASASAINFTSGKVVIGFLSEGVVGRFVVGLPRSSAADAIIQSFVVGTGAATYTVEGSLDGVHFETIATVTHLGVTNDTKSTKVPANWAYLGINVSAIGVATKLTTLYSA